MSTTTETTRDRRHEPVLAASSRYLELGGMRAGDLETVFLRGHTPDTDDLVGWEFRGMNQPIWARALGIKKFIKGFEQRTDAVYGYNTPVVQNKVTDPWISKPRGRQSKRFGYYHVDRVDPTARDNEYLHAILLDYGRGGNKPWDPSGGLRDYVIQVDADNPNLFLGKAYYALGRRRIATNFFVLERLRAADAR